METREESEAANEEFLRLLKMSKRPVELQTLQARMALLAFLGQRLQEDSELKVKYDYWVGRLGLE
jgi:hypothetical protein